MEKAAPNIMPPVLSTTDKQETTAASSATQAPTLDCELEQLKFATECGTEASSTSTNSTVASFNKTRPLLTLPLELRNEIYLHTLVPISKVKPRNPTPPPHRVEHQLNVNLLCTCKQILVEALAVFHRHAELEIPIICLFVPDSEGNNDLQSYTSNMPASFARFKNIHVTFCVRESFPSKPEYQYVLGVFKDIFRKVREEQGDGKGKINVLLCCEHPLLEDNDQDGEEEGLTPAERIACIANEWQRTSSALEILAYQLSSEDGVMVEATSESFFVKKHYGSGRWFKLFAVWDPETRAVKVQTWGFDETEPENVDAHLRGHVSMLAHLHTNA